MAKRDAALMVAAGVAAALYLMFRDNAEYELEEVPMSDLPPVGEDDGQVYDPDEPWEYTMPLSDPDRNLYAFLYMIRAAEHSQADALSGNAYRVFYGGSTFHGTNDHPALTGEKSGVRLPDEFCRAVGLSPGCVSTAAGAYQINVPTWKQFRVASRLGPFLPDFSNASQDEAARRILVSDGVMPLIAEGNIELAIARASRRWASLPGSTAKQGGRSMAWALQKFQDGLTEVL